MLSLKYFILFTLIQFSIQQFTATEILESTPTNNFGDEVIISSTTEIETITTEKINETEKSSTVSDIEESFTSVTREDYTGTLQTVTEQTTSVKFDNFNNSEQINGTINFENLPTINENDQPFYEKAIHHIVKVVEENILEEDKEIQETSPLHIKEDSNITEPRLDKLSGQIRQIISYYQTYGVVTVPNADVPDPMEIPDMKRTFGGSPTTFTNMTLFGLSNFSIDHVNTDLNKMQVYVLIIMKRLVIIGNYSVRSWLGRSAGKFNITLLDVEAEAAAGLERIKNGTLQATESEMDMSFRDSVVDFKNIGLMGSIFQSVLSTATPIIFEAIKPIILKQINEKVRDNINDKLRTIGNRLAISGNKPPIDAAVEEGRKYVKENGYDPYYVRDFIFKKKNVLAVNITEFTLYGLANFYRVGEFVLAMDQGIIQIGVHVASLNLNGKLKWSVLVGKSFSKEGKVNFTIDHIQMRGLVNQSIDVKRKPVLDKLDINVGKVRTKVVGAGRYDFFVELIVNTLPDTIRHIIVESLEEPLKYKIQQILDKIETDVLLEKTLPELDNMGL